ncbi:MAG: hypothetical protein LUD48_04095, partial [Prevotella sp.]|nr:hypothetical protein [Prevotella sp.]
SSQNANSMNNTQQIGINELLQSLQSRLPMQLIDDDMVMTAVNLEDDQLSFIVSVSPNYFQNLGSNQEINSDRYVANLMQVWGDYFVNLLIDNNIGVMYRYIKRDDSSVKRETDVSAARLREIWHKMRSGDVEPMTLIEQIEAGYEDMDFPVKLAGGLLWTKAYVDGNKVCYVYRFEGIEDMDTNSEKFREIYNGLRKEMITGLREEKTFQLHQKKLFDEDIHFEYTFTNEYGRTLFTINVMPQDIFPE